MTSRTALLASQKTKKTKKHKKTEKTKPPNSDYPQRAAQSVAATAVLILLDQKGTKHWGGGVPRGEVYPPPHAFSMGAQRARPPSNFAKFLHLSSASKLCLRLILKYLCIPLLKSSPWPPRIPPGLRQIYNCIIFFFTFLKFF